MKYVNVFENFDQDIKQLIHVTTVENSELIKKDGFIPKPFIDYKYYSNLGKDGIYFYDNLRQVQQYSYFLNYKTKEDKVALIYVSVPKDIIKMGEKLEDGYFIKRDDLNKINIIKIEYKKPSDIY